MVSITMIDVTIDFRSNSSLKANKIKTNDS